MPAKSCGYCFVPMGVVWGLRAGLVWALSLNPGGGGTSTNVQVDEDYGCTPGQEPDVTSITNAIGVFVAERTFFLNDPNNGYNTLQRMQRWAAEHPYGSSYSVTWPNGTTGEYRVGNPNSPNYPLDTGLSCS